MSTVSARRRRHSAILELLLERPIRSQEALREALADRGHSVTQSTLSRDLKQLRIVRMSEPDGYRYVAAREQESSSEEPLDAVRILVAEVVGVESNEVLVVLRTRVGRAQGVAVYLDRYRPAGVLATLAGDDTVLVVPESIQGVEALGERLSALFDSSEATVSRR